MQVLGKSEQTVGEVLKPFLDQIDRLQPPSSPPPPPSFPSVDDHRRRRLLVLSSPSTRIRLRCNGLDLLLDASAQHLEQQHVQLMAASLADRSITGMSRAIFEARFRLIGRVNCARSTVPNTVFLSALVGRILLAVKSFNFLSKIQGKVSARSLLAHLKFERQLRRQPQRWLRFFIFSSKGQHMCVCVWCHTPSVSMCVCVMIIQVMILAHYTFKKLFEINFLIN